MLQNASLLAIVAVYTAENAPSEVGDAVMNGRGRRRPAAAEARLRRRAVGDARPLLAFTFLPAAFFRHGKGGLSERSSGS